LELIRAAQYVSVICNEYVAAVDQMANKVVNVVPFVLVAPICRLEAGEDGTLNVFE
jgi:hypothetical protein